MRYIRPQITTVAGERIVESIGPATAATSGATMPRPSVLRLVEGGDADDAAR